MNLLFSFSEFLYKRNFSLYYRLYSFYKTRQDKSELNLFKKIIKPGTVVIDIGANVGFYSNYFSKLTGSSGVIHCFEPDALNYKYLEKTTSSLNNIHLNNKAVTEDDKSLTLYTSHRLNVDHRTYPVNEYAKSYEVKATSIDNYVNGKYKVDFIKMDIQGAEYPALIGMQKTLQSNPEILLLMEIAPSALKEFGTTPKAIFDFVHSIGFHLYDFDLRELMEKDTAKYDAYKMDEFENVIIAKQIPSFLQ